MKDIDGFEAFYEGCRDSIYAAVLVTCGDESLACEATDEAFTRAAERWSHVRGLDRPAGWVYRVATNWVTSWHRKWSLRPTKPVEVLDRATTDALPDLDLARQLLEIPAQQRQMLVLRYALGYSIEETAAVLDVAAGTVKSGVHRAREQMRRRAEALDGPG